MVSLSEKNLPSADVLPDQLEQGSSLWHDAWARLRKNKLAVAGGLVLVVLTLLCICGPWFSQTYQDQNLDLGATPRGLTVPEIRAYFLRETETWTKVIAAAGLKVE